jgi:hypothetical protein
MIGRLVRSGMLFCRGSSREWISLKGSEAMSRGVGDEATLESRAERF